MHGVRPFVAVHAWGAGDARLVQALPHARGARPLIDGARARFRRGVYTLRDGEEWRKSLAGVGDNNFERQGKEDFGGYEPSR